MRRGCVSAMASSRDANTTALLTREARDADGPNEAVDLAHGHGGWHSLLLARAASSLAFLIAPPSVDQRAHAPHEAHAECLDGCRPMLAARNPAQPPSSSRRHPAREAVARGVPISLAVDFAFEQSEREPGVNVEFACLRARDAVGRCDRRCVGAAAPCSKWERAAIVLPKNGLDPIGVAFAPSHHITH